MVGHLERIVVNETSVMQFSRCFIAPAELHHAGFIYYNLHDARSHENRLPEFLLPGWARRDNHVTKGDVVDLILKMFLII